MAAAQPTPHPRLGVPALPAGSTARFALLAVVLSITGAFSGTWLHLLLGSERYVARASACQADARRATQGLPGPLAEITRIAREDWCRAGEERRRAAFMLGGVLLTWAGGAVIVLAGPAVKERRRRLRPADPAGPAGRYVAGLAVESGLRRPPRLRIGRLDLKDPFSYGRPGDHRIALPKTLLVARVEDPRLFDAVLRHEMAHLRHGDVAWSRVAASVWYVLAPMLIAPLAVSLAGPGRSLVPGYLWRAAVLAVVVHLVVAATLRDREFDADLSAAGQCGVEPVAAALAHTRKLEGRWSQRGPLARHPGRERRLAVLRHPELAATVTFADGAVAAFLAATAVPLLAELIFTALTGTGSRPAAHVAGALTAGLLLGAVVGLGLLRLVVVGRAAAARISIVRVALGVGAGLPLGQAVSLAGTGTAGLAGLAHPLWLFAAFVFGAGATVLCAGAATVLTDAAGRTRTARAVWLPAVVFATAAYAVAVWMSERVEFVGDTLGVEGLLAWAVTALHTPFVIGAASVPTVIVAGAVLAGGSARAPAWLTPGSPAESPPGRRWSPPRTHAVAALLAGAAAGVSTGIVMIANRLVRGAATTEAEQVMRYYTAVWIAVAGGAAVTLVLCVMSPRRGPALVAIALPVAVGGACLALAALSTAQGRPPSLDALGYFVKLSLPLAAVLALALGTSALFSSRAHARRSAAGDGRSEPLRAALAALAAGAVTVLLAGGIAMVPELLVPAVLLAA